MNPTLDLKATLDAHRKWLDGDAGGTRADLRDADLTRADLTRADLTDADLTDADLTGAVLRDADLTRADLTRADLRDADLTRADLTGAVLTDAKEIPPLVAAQLTIVPEGLLVGWKKCRGGVIAQLTIPAEARRSNATGRKCRAEFVDVVAVHGAEVGISQHDGTTEYRAGQRVTCDAWNGDRWTECGGGIHFLLTRVEAEAY